MLRRAILRNAYVLGGSLILLAAVTGCTAGPSESEPAPFAPEVVRFVAMDEWASVIVSCLHDEGFNQVSSGLTGDGIEYSNIPDAQMQAFENARSSCSDRYPLDPKYQQPLTPEMLGILYDYNVGELTDCLAELGYTPSAPPSRQSFTDSYHTDPWMPFADASDQARERGSEAIGELYATCNETPEAMWD